MDMEVESFDDSSYATCPVCGEAQDVEAPEPDYADLIEQRDLSRPIFD